MGTPRIRDAGVKHSFVADDATLSLPARFCRFYLVLGLDEPGRVSSSRTRSPPRGQSTPYGNPAFTPVLRLLPVGTLAGRFSLLLDNCLSLPDEVWRTARQNHDAHLRASPAPLRGPPAYSQYEQAPPHGL
jgi:hypothetical protein